MYKSCYLQGHNTRPMMGRISSAATSRGVLPKEFDLQTLSEFH